jgi:hypothetical protein
MIKLILLSLIIYIFNIPFGYWRTNVRKFSLQWALAIHVPIPFIIALRILSNIGFGIETYIFFVSAFFLGQLTGKKIFEVLKLKLNQAQTSCLVVDVFQIIRRA